VVSRRPKRFFAPSQGKPPFYPLPILPALWYSAVYSFRFVFGSGEQLRRLSRGHCCFSLDDPPSVPATRAGGCRGRHECGTGHLVARLFAWNARAALNARMHFLACERLVRRLILALILFVLKMRSPTPVWC
jgi:hypothetical protein